ncbi:hypothetical protein K1T71_010436 [Dendrolimus kikuchii]|uniref:Uncharacterized protein n=1 Tax=Dendrolimus kikuchii TaxID=765133 RepID=A0ACC1CS88_9NEOP|nr:hypothetical protein K1T71_010436 [Dendrolimus kikuchii]
MYTRILVVIVATAYAVNGGRLLDPEYLNRNYQRTPLGDAIDKASLKLLNEAYKSAADKNVVSSPLGIMTLLALFEEGAGPETKQQINQYLGVSDNQKSSESFSDLSKKLAEDPSYLTVANKIYVSDRYTLNDHFADVAKTYDSGVETINFGNRETAAAAINKWADEKTKGHIKDPVKADTLDPATAVALFNVIFFQGHWAETFSKHYTVDKDFHINNSTTVKKPTMHLLEYLFYTENKELGAKMIELPFIEEGFRMVVVLPDEIDGLPKVLEKAAETGLLTDVGISNMFQEGAPGIVKDDTVVVSEASQDAFIKIDEEGVIAAALTTFYGVPTSAIIRVRPPIIFKVDHSFLYLILYQDKILFAGTVTH